MDDLDANIETALYIFYNEKSGVNVDEDYVLLTQSYFYNVELDNLHIDIGISLESLWQNRLI